MPDRTPMPACLRAAALLLLAAASVTLTACTTNPATGRTNFNPLASREVSIGEEAAPQFLEQNGGELPAPGINAYVADLGSRLAAASERPELPWSFKVVDSAQVNAFALPGGKVFISRGILDRMENEAELAAVLGHEIGHVTAQHGTQQMSQALGINALAVGLGLAGELSDEEALTYAGIGVGAGGNLYLLSYGRGQELEADALGIRYMTRLGYDPTGMVGLLSMLAEGSEDPGLMVFLSTHPAPGQRIGDARELIEREYQSPRGGWPKGLAAQRYRRTVLDPLAELPPPTHGNARSSNPGQRRGDQPDPNAQRERIRRDLREHGVAVLGTGLTLAEALGRDHDAGQASAAAGHPACFHRPVWLVVDADRFDG